VRGTRAAPGGGTLSLVAGAADSLLAPRPVERGVAGNVGSGWRELELSGGGAALSRAKSARKSLGLAATATVQLSEEYKRQITRVERITGTAIGRLGAQAGHRIDLHRRGSEVPPRRVMREADVPGASASPFEQ